MKRAVILHGTQSTPKSNWFTWLKRQLESEGYEVWVPQLPGADYPNARKYTNFLMSAPWDFKDNLVIGHSSGAVEILHLLDNLPDHAVVKAAILVSAFDKSITNDPEWERLMGLFTEPFDYADIERKAQNIIFVHAADDPYCEPRKTRELAQEMDAEYIELPSGGHFSASLSPEYRQFPELMAILEERTLL
jgi:predicted alpha/beta hydrolase family esterase